MSDPDLYRYKAEVIRVVDGDTFEALIDVGFAIKIAASVRIVGIDAPELKGDNKEAGQEAKEALARLLADRSVRIRTEKPDSFGRALAEVWIDSKIGGWFSVSEHMIRSGYAVPKTKKGGAK